MREFLARLGPNDRVLLIGDTRQHQGVEAGRPFEQLQEAGMRTARLDEIVRQKDPALKFAVELLATGQVSAALDALQQPVSYTHLDVYKRQLIESGRTHSGFLQLLEGAARFDALMLAGIADQKHTVIGTKPRKKLAHLVLSLIHI